MACCGGKARTLRKQFVKRPDKPKKKAVSVQRINKNTAGGQRTITVHRQKVVPRQKCECGFPSMAVNIAGRERIQCSNPNCRKILK